MLSPVTAHRGGLQAGRAVDVVDDGRRAAPSAVGADPLVVGADDAGAVGGGEDRGGGVGAQIADDLSPWW